jgi:hypothetical protein
MSATFKPPSPVWTNDAQAPPPRTPSREPEPRFAASGVDTITEPIPELPPELLPAPNTAPSASEAPNEPEVPQGDAEPPDAMELIAGLDPAAAQLRILPIAANLLPVEVVERRRERSLKQAVIAGVLAVVVFLGGWYALSIYQRSSAQDDLTASQDAATHLVREQQAYSEVVTAQAATTKISGELAALLTQDLSWSDYVGSVERSAPKGVILTAVNAAVKPPAQGAAVAGAPGAAGKAETASGLPSATSQKVIGTLTVDGSAGSKSQVAAFADALGAVKGVGTPLITTVNQQDARLLFTIKADVTNAAPGGRWATAVTGGK